jgi:tetratricopeptide (TPR) repeat protein
MNGLFNRRSSDPAGHRAAAPSAAQFEHGSKTMILEWFNASEAAKIGVALADQFAPQQPKNSTTHGQRSAKSQPSDLLQKILERVDREVRSLRLNFYKKAKFANSFKWRLLENGVDKAVADEVTQRLVLHLSANQAEPVPGYNSEAEATDRPRSNDASFLSTQAIRALDRGAYAEAITFYQDLIKRSPRDAAAHNNLGTALFKMNRYREAEACFHKAMKLKKDYPDPHGNLGTIQLMRGSLHEAEISLRHALKLNPRHVDARINLGLTLIALSRLRDAKAQFEKVLKITPRNANALLGLSLVAKSEGHFDDAAAMLSRALEVNPKMPSGLASFAGIRKLTASDQAWLQRAEEVAASGIAAADESELRFAIGKYYADIEDFERAFENYKRANELLKPALEAYDRDGYTRFVDGMIRTYPREAVAGVAAGASPSMQPVFVVGMPRSGTSLIEQIIASHPSAKGAGELEFWTDAVRKHQEAVRQGRFDESTMKELTEAYLRELRARCGDAARIVDKAPVNSDYLGVIHSAFTNARIIYVQRDPIDTCLSCYFQKFILSLNFTFDLSDLAYYYREHARLMEHWRAVLPPGAILDVPYEDLIADQEGWTRKILDFLALEWDKRCLDFHATKRPVLTASSWQVRQKIYKNSVQRWRNYQKFIGPLLALRKLGRTNRG